MTKPDGTLKSEDGCAAPLQSNNGQPVALGEFNYVPVADLRAVAGVGQGSVDLGGVGDFGADSLSSEEWRQLFLIKPDRTVLGQQSMQQTSGANCTTAAVTRGRCCPL